MKKFSLRDLIPKFFLIEEDEESKRNISIKDYFEETKTGDVELYGPPLNQTYIFRDLKKDVTIDCAAIKGPKPWTLEYTIAFRFQPTHNLIMKYRPAAVRRSKEGEEEYKYGDIRDYPQQTLAFLKYVKNRFGKNSIYKEIDNLKRKVDQKFFNEYPILEWAEPKIAYLWSEGVLDNFIKDISYQSSDSYGTQERDTKTFSTREGTNIDFGFYIRFELPLDVTVSDKERTTDQKINRFVAYKAKYFGEQLLNLPMLTSDEDFMLKPGRIER